MNYSFEDALTGVFRLWISRIKLCKKIACAVGKNVIRFMGKRDG